MKPVQSAREATALGAHDPLRFELGNVLVGGVQVCLIFGHSLIVQPFFCVSLLGKLFAVVGLLSKLIHKSVSIRVDRGQLSLNFFILFHQRRVARV